MKIRTLLALGLLAIGLAGCGQRVAPGHVGIAVNQYGQKAGVQMQVLGVGRYMEPWGTDIVEYPVTTKNYTFTVSDKEGHGENEEIAFQDKSGLALSSDVSVNYSADPLLVPVLFQKYGASAGEDSPVDRIVAGPVRNAIRDSMIRRASSLNIDEINGPGRSALLAGVQSDVAAYFAPQGLKIERLFWAGNIRMPDNVLHQINARIANEQEALAATAQVATKTAQAAQLEAEATGKANALNTEGEAIRKNPEVLRIRAIEKWNGVLPQVTSGATPFIEVGK